MLSMAGVRSASGAANYFAKDDYYTAEGSSEISAWGGEGAADLGLSGRLAPSGKPKRTASDRWVCSVKR